MNNQITVLVPFYNPGTYLAQAVESVFKQSHKDWLLILIDDASTEDYLPRLQHYLTDPRVTLVRHLQNMGQSITLNTGLSYTKTRFAVQLDSDDLFFPYTLEYMVRESVQQPENVALICGNMQIFFEDADGRITSKKIRTGASFSGRYQFLLANTTLCPRFYRVSALQKIGGWPLDDPYCGRYREDMRILYRLIEHYRFHWIDKVLYKVRIHKSNHTHQVKLYTEMMEWSVRDALRRWGNYYEPTFETVEGGWKRILGLKPRKSGTG